MNVGVVVIIFLLVLSFLGVPIFIALGIGTLVALHMADTVSYTHLTLPTIRLV